MNIWKKSEITMASKYKELGINRKAHYDYEILDKFEAGIVLLGSEVKSLRNNNSD